MAVQIQLTGPAHEVDRIAAAIGRVVQLDHTNATRTDHEAGRIVACYVAPDHRADGASS